MARNRENEPSAPSSEEVEAALETALTSSGDPDIWEAEVANFFASNENFNRLPPESRSWLQTKYSDEALAERRRAAKEAKRAEAGKAKREKGKGKDNKKAKPGLASVAEEILPADTGSDEIDETKAKPDYRSGNTDTEEAILAADLAARAERLRQPRQQPGAAVKLPRVENKQETNSEAEKPRRTFDYRFRKDENGWYLSEKQTNIIRAIDAAHKDSFRDSFRDSGIAIPESLQPLLENAEVRTRIEEFCRLERLRLDRPFKEGGLTLNFDRNGRVGKGSLVWKFDGFLADEQGQPIFEEGKPSIGPVGDELVEHAAKWNGQGPMTKEMINVLPEFFAELANKYNRNSSDIYRDPAFKDFMRIAAPLKASEIISQHLAMLRGVDDLPPAPERKPEPAPKPPVVRPPARPTTEPADTAIQGTPVLEVPVTAVTPEESEPAKLTSTDVTEAAYDAIETKATEQNPIAAQPDRQNVAVTETEAGQDKAAAREKIMEVITAEVKKLAAAYKEIHGDNIDFSHARTIYERIPDLIDRLPLAREFKRDPRFRADVRGLIFKELGLPLIISVSPEREVFFDKSDAKRAADVPPYSELSIDERKGAVNVAITGIVDRAFDRLLPAESNTSAARIKAAKLLMQALEKTNFKMKQLQFNRDTGEIIIPDEAALDNIIVRVLGKK